MPFGNILLILLVLTMVGTLPTWQYSAGWGYLPSSGVGVVVIAVIGVLLAERL